MKIVAMSDSHWKLNGVKVPEGDVFVFAGDWSAGRNQITDVISFSAFLSTIKCKHKLVVAGNHDRIGQREPSLTAKTLADAGAEYLLDSGLTIDGVTFWGSPWCPQFMNWAFMGEEFELARHFSHIPKKTDVLITHSPPYGTLDRLPNHLNVGSTALEERVKEVRPAVHIFGHIHCGYGTAKSDYTQFYNVSVCDDDYALVHEPTIIEV